MSSNTGLEIAILGSIARVKADIGDGDGEKILRSTRRLHELFAEAERMNLPGLEQMARQAQAMTQQALFKLQGSAAPSAVGGVSGARATYRTIEGLAS